MATRLFLQHSAFLLHESASSGLAGGGRGGVGLGDTTYFTGCCAMLCRPGENRKGVVRWGGASIGACLFVHPQASRLQVIPRMMPGAASGTTSGPATPRPVPPRTARPTPPWLHISWPTASTQCLIMEDRGQKRPSDYVRKGSGGRQTKWKEKCIIICDVGYEREAELEMRMGGDKRQRVDG